MAARFRLRKGSLLFVSVYAPTSTATDDIINNFYSQLQDVINSNKKNCNTLVVAGDFNAKLGNQRIPLVMGPHGHGDRNSRGDRLVDFCMVNNLTAAHSWFPKRSSHKVTWISRARNARNAIDHILISTEARNHLTDCRSYSACFDTDHWLVICNLKWKFRRHATARGLRPQHPNVEALKSEQSSEVFRQLVRSRVTQGDSLEAVACVIHEASLKTCGTQISQKKQPYLSELTLHLIQRKRKAVGTPEFTALRNEVKHACQKDLNEWLVTNINTLNQAYQNHNCRAMFKTTDVLLQKTCTPVVNIKDANGLVLETAEEEIQRWHQYAVDLFESNRPRPPHHTTEVE
ncbi:craniofacial development protein 2-like [Patiria miniata]|uniref:Endonuclease/exonuclease/phosphatase domain-containing protein n=1 Tax=Patiria miniata TaxID=46514 RepID=A0A913YZL3_PATMI|nr:craniofacial development protein 2-like [Patiria miniata]